MATLQPQGTLPPVPVRLPKCCAMSPPSLAPGVHMDSSRWACHAEARQSAGQPGAAAAEGRPHAPRGGVLLHPAQGARRGGWPVALLEHPAYGAGCLQPLTAPSWQALGTAVGQLYRGRSCYLSSSPSRWTTNAFICPSCALHGMQPGARGDAVNERKASHHTRRRVCVDHLRGASRVAGVLISSAPSCLLQRAVGPSRGLRHLGASTPR